MKKILLAIVSIVIYNLSYSQFCNSNGNLIIYSNYDGGTLTINVDQNIPNLKIGIISYEAVSVTFTGPYVGNITAVEWAGYNANNGHCVPNVPTTVISGVSSSIVTQSVLPSSTYSDPNGNAWIVCAYGCGAGNQGGCNTAIQIADYFLNTLGGSLYYHYLQYGCWNTTLNVSSGGNCCDQPATNNPPVADFTFPAINYCMDDCISFTDNSTNIPTTWSWTFSGGNPATSASQNPSVCYNNSGTYSVTLVAQNAYGSDTYTTNVTINSVNTSVSQSGNTLTAISSGATYQWIDCSNNSAVSGETAQSFSPAVNGNYALVITENGCTDTSGCVAITTVGIRELSFGEFASLYPNPSEGVIYLKIVNSRLNGNSFSIKNILGEEVLSEKINKNEMMLDLHDFPSGVYFLQIETPGGMVTQKFVMH